MSRRKVVKEELEERIEEAEVVMRWSSKKIVIATLVVIMIIAGGLYAISLMSQNPTTKVLGQTAVDVPQIKIPDESVVEDVIKKAKEDLSGINAKNIISSQPKLQQIINDLTNLTESSKSAKNIICDTVCKE